MTRTNELIQRQIVINNQLLTQMQHNQQFIAALDRDRRTGDGVAEDLTRIFDLLVSFQHKNPQTFAALCAEARDSGDSTLADALDAIAHAAGLVQE